MDYNFGCGRSIYTTMIIVTAVAANIIERISDNPNGEIQKPLSTVVRKSFE